MGMNSLYNRVACLTYRTADMMGEYRGCMEHVATGGLDEESPTGERGHPQQPRALDNEGGATFRVESRRGALAALSIEEMVPWLSRELVNAGVAEDEGEAGGDIEYRQWCPHDSRRSVSTSESQS
jgi:hypothetical protein